MSHRVSVSYLDVRSSDDRLNYAVELECLKLPHPAVNLKSPKPLSPAGEVVDEFEAKTSGSVAVFRGPGV